MLMANHYSNGVMSTFNLESEIQYDSKVFLNNNDNKIWFWLAKI